MKASESGIFRAEKGRLIQAVLPRVPAGSSVQADLGMWAAVRLLACRFRFNASAAIGTRFPKVQLVLADGGTWEQESVNGVVAGASAFYFFAENRATEVVGGNLYSPPMAGTTWIAPGIFSITAQGIDVADTITQAILVYLAWAEAEP